MTTESHTISFAICDDEPEAVHFLKESVVDFLTESSVTEYNLFLYNSTLEMIKDGAHIDIALVDIEVGGDQDGLDIAEYLHQRNENVSVIIVTGFPHYLDDAMDRRVYRFITKPVDRDRLFRALRSAVKRCRYGMRKAHFTTDKGARVIPCNEILCVEAQAHYVVLHTLHGDITVRDNFNECVKHLDSAGFARCHRSYLANLRYVTSYDQKTVCLNARIPAAGDDKSDDSFRLKEVTFNAYMSGRRYFKEFQKEYLTWLEVNRE